MARSLPVENLLPQNVGSIINYLQYSTEVAQWGTPSCSRLQPQPATPERIVHSINRCSSDTAGIRSCNLLHARQPPCLCGHSGYKCIFPFFVTSLLSLSIIFFYIMNNPVIVTGTNYFVLWNDFLLQYYSLC